MTDAIENRILNQLMTELNKIGTPPASWNTTPEAPVEGVPGDAVTITTKPKLFVHVASSDPRSEQVPSGNVHKWKTTFQVWVADKTQRGCNSLKSDVLRAVYAAEATFATAFGGMLFPAGYAINASMNATGVWIALQQLTIEYETDHSTP